MYQKVVYAIVNVCVYIAGTITIVLMAFTICDVLGRYVFNHPISGSYEITELAQATLVSLVLCYTAARDKHVTITLVSLGGKRQAICNSITYFIGAVIVALISWQSYVYGIGVWKSGLIAGVSAIPIAPFLFILAFGSALFCLVLLLKVTEFAREAFRK